jgi:hypothetical protein
MLRGCQSVWGAVTGQSFETSARENTIRQNEKATVTDAYCLCSKSMTRL